MTLLEVMLALALTALVLIAVGMAIDFHLRVVDVRRTGVEQAQLARAVLRMMADDLRSAVRDEPADFSGAAELASDTAGDNVDELEGLIEGSGLDEPAEDQTQDIAGSATPTSEPGLYGNQYELLVDVTRPPRVDQFAVVLSADADGGPLDVPSDVKSVAYYLLEDLDQADRERASITETAGTANRPASQALSSPGRGRGLVRRSLSRAVAEWAEANGNLASLDRNAQVLAPEVVALQFRYFDGTEWLDEWNSKEEGGLPVAVEIAIAIESLEDGDRPRALSSASLDANKTEQGDVIYRLTVHLPAARPTTDEDEVEAEEEEQL